MVHEGHRLRMRERYGKQGGLDGFAPHEVLELWLYYAIPQKNVNALAHELLDRFGSLHGVFHADPQQLKQVKGIGEYASTFLSLLPKVVKYMEMERAGESVKISNRKEAEDYCVRLLAGEKRELFYAVCMNGQMQVLHNALIAKGSLSNVPAYPRVVAEAVLNHNAHSVMLCHNHPGGSVFPSQGDMEVTRQLAALLHGLEVVLIDHMIVTEKSAFSMLSHHLIEQSSSAAGITTKVADSAGETRIRNEMIRQQKAEKGEQTE